MDLNTDTCPIPSSSVILDERIDKLCIKKIRLCKRKHIGKEEYAESCGSNLRPARNKDH